jgi:hypothetical protein
MNGKQVTLPGPDHPISIQRNPARVVVSVAGRVVADNAVVRSEEPLPAYEFKSVPGYEHTLTWVNPAIRDALFPEWRKSMKNLLELAH